MIDPFENDENDSLREEERAAMQGEEWCQTCKKYMPIMHDHEDSKNEDDFRLEDR